MEESSEPITFICPTRGRIHNVSRLIESSTATYSGSTRLNFMFYMDDDDSKTIDLVKSISLSDPNITVTVTVGPRIIMSEMSNILARKSEKGILFFCGDDIVMESKDWDIKVRDEFRKVKDKILLVYGDDGLMHESLATHFFLHSNWVDTLGYMVPPIFTGDWVDNYVSTVATMLDRKIYLPEVKTTHYHPTAGKAAMDTVYLEKYNRDVKSNPQLTFFRSGSLRDSDVKKLKGVMENY